LVLVSLGGEYHCYQQNAYSLVIYGPFISPLSKRETLFSDSSLLIVSDAEGASPKVVEKRTNSHDGLRASAALLQNFD